MPLFLGWLVVWGASWVLPVRYKSGTLILVEQPTMPKNYVAPNVSEDLQEPIASIQQQILSRTRLLLIIDKLHLYSDGHGQIHQMKKLSSCARTSNIELVRDSRAAPITAFKIYLFGARSACGPAGDQRTNRPIHQRKPEGAPATVPGHDEFIESQLENARATLAEQEAKVREFEGAARRRIAFPASEQSPNPERAPITVAKRTGHSQHGETAAGLSSDFD